MRSFWYNGKTAMFLDGDLKTIKSSTYYINGVKQTPKFKIESQTSSSREDYTLQTKTTTYKTKYKPAIMVKPKDLYFTLSVENGVERSDILIKRDFHTGMIIWNWLFTFSVGSYIDVITGNIYDLPTISMKDANSGKSVIYPTERETRLKEEKTLKNILLR
jgi:hypothetical protein